MAQEKFVAHNQDELKELLNKGSYVIELEGGPFNIPKGVAGRTFIGIGGSLVNVTVYSEEFDNIPNAFHNVQCDKLYLTRSALFREAQNANNPSYKWNAYKKLAETGNIDGLLGVAECYEKGIGIPKDICTAEKYYNQAASLGSARAMFYLANFYEFVLRNCNKAEYWYRKAAELGYNTAQQKVADIDKLRDFSCKDKY